MSLAVANRYARALSELVLAPGSGLDPRDALEQLREVERALEISPELRIALMSPAVAAADKEDVVKRLTERMGLSRLVKNFVLVIVNHRRVPLAASIVEAFEKTLDERLGRVRAMVTSAAALSGEQQRKVEAQLVARTGKQVRSDYRIDPSLLGGVSVQIGSTIYDGSVRGRLQALKTRMASE